MLKLESTCPHPPEGAQVPVPGIDQRACSSITNMWADTLTCKILDIIVIQSPADPAKPPPPHSPSVLSGAVTARGSGAPVQNGNGSSHSHHGSTLCYGVGFFVVVVSVFSFGFCFFEIQLFVLQMFPLKLL